MSERSGGKGQEKKTINLGRNSWRQLRFGGVHRGVKGFLTTRRVRRRRKCIQIAGTWWRKEACAQTIKRARTLVKGPTYPRQQENWGWAKLYKRSAGTTNVLGEKAGGTEKMRRFLSILKKKKKKIPPNGHGERAASGGFALISDTVPGMGPTGGRSKTCSLNEKRGKEKTTSGIAEASFSVARVCQKRIEEKRGEGGLRVVAAPLGDEGSGEKAQ